MKRIVVASVNPVKVQAVLKGFQEMFPEEQFTASSIRVDSGVHAQPSSNEETLAGALNRAKEAIKQINEADYWVGIEGGIENLGGEISVFAWIIIKSQELIGKSRTASFLLPPNISELLNQGQELSVANDTVFGTQNISQGIGTIGILTGDVLSRLDVYTHGVLLALVPFKNTELYSQAPPKESRS